MQISPHLQFHSKGVFAPILLLLGSKEILSNHGGREKLGSQIKRCFCHPGNASFFFVDPHPSYVTIFLVIFKASALKCNHVRHLCLDEYSISNMKKMYKLSQENLNSKTLAVILNDICQLIIQTLNLLPNIKDG